MGVGVAIGNFLTQKHVETMATSERGQHLGYEKVAKSYEEEGELGFFFFAAHQNSVYDAIVTWSASNLCHA